MVLIEMFKENWRQVESNKEREIMNVNWGSENGEQ